MSSATIAAMLRNYANLLDRLPTSLATAIVLLGSGCPGCITPCSPVPPPPADCATFAATDQLGRFTITITPACGLDDETITLTNRRTDASFEVSIAADGTSPPTPFTRVALGDEFAFLPEPRGCRSTGCFRFEGLGPAAECEGIE